MSTTIYSRAVLYADGSDIETGVSFDPTYRLGDDHQSYVKIKGAGSGDISVRVDHIHLLKQWLDEAVVADLDYRKLQAREREKP